ncbi:MAG: SGNH/GDSL hydrolase family protein [Polyangiales bacterium]
MSARFTFLVALSLAASAFVGCSSSDAVNVAGGDSGPGSDTAPTPGTDTGGDTAKPPAGALAFKTYVVLGDSISANGGEGPYFDSLLMKNDDTKWPDYKGQDLTTKYGAIKLEKHSKGGSTAVNLDSQVAALPKTLEGPVLVTITIGGNDVQAALPTVLGGGSDDAKRTQFQGYIQTALDELTAPGRFGEGVQVRVILANIYDPSDGTGNFTFATGTKCGGALGFWPAGKETKSILDKWEDAMAVEAVKHPEVVYADLRARFDGHGVPSTTETWFVKDCIHPNSAGHTQVRGLMWEAVKNL